MEPVGLLTAWPWEAKLACDFSSKLHNRPQLAVWLVRCTHLESFRDLNLDSMVSRRTCRSIYPKLGCTGLIENMTQLGPCPETDTGTLASESWGSVCLSIGTGIIA